MDTASAVLAHEPLIRLVLFAAGFAVIAACEVLVPRRTPTMARSLRWFGNLGIAALSSVVVRLAFPLAAVGMAGFAAANGWGMLNHFDVPPWLAGPLAVIALDFVIWLQHVIVHAVPVLWRLHRVHHADLDFDLTTGLRFHPIEIALSMLIKFAAIVVLGPPVVAVLVFEVLLNATSMFSHANIRLPAALDRVLRWIVVTPEMHRVHHSVEDDETNSNFGFNLPWWDRLFGTYRDQPRAGHAAMTIGIHSHRDPQEVARLPGMLMLPFRGDVEGYAINRREWRGEHATTR
ncbi:MAG: sterol desaturase family protein [Burkholderiaceae bacterium]|nr:sterol desaturase family protein [Burkholderiaceae bacterium]